MGGTPFALAQWQNGPPAEVQHLKGTGSAPADSGPQVARCSAALDGKAGAGGRAPAAARSSAAAAAGSGVRALAQQRKQRDGHSHSAGATRGGRGQGSAV